MHPAFSVIFLTTLIGAGQGLFLALYTGQVYAVAEVLSAQSNPQTFYGIGSLLALVLLVAGLAASFFHLGHPERAWRSAARWRTSWLSREVLVLPAFIGMVAIYGLIHYLGMDVEVFRISDKVSISLSLVAGAITAVLGFALFLCTSMIYACMKFLQEWHTPLTVVNYTLLGSTSGFTLAAAFAAWGANEFTQFYIGWAILFSVLSFITKIASMIRNQRIQSISSLQTAIGIRHPNIVQKAQGAMGGSFNTREFSHGKSDGFIKGMQWIFMVFTFLIPVTLLLACMSNPSVGLLAAAFVIQYLGLIAERWLFFAQSSHPQNLYYQTV
ncbi:MAG: dimethyl sulfoxide reductase anchor subunit [Gammaproteobacteria bacterium]|nr:dimethyl sulfoxide reductase anchor subunit [Gammaproteobacteria bacterium]